MPGLTVLFDGRLSNKVELAERLGLPSQSNAAETYGAAIARWDIRADHRAIGVYAAIGRTREGNVRLSRSPWNAPPLFWARWEGCWLVASIPRPIFAGGLPKRLKPNAIAEALYGIENPEGGYWWEQLNAVPHGSVVTLQSNGGDPMIDRWYDPLALPDISLPNDEAYVDQANALLTEGVGHALREAGRPGILLSGGLDSAIVADEMLRQLPSNHRLSSFTFVPAKGSPLHEPPGMFGDERASVEAFARMHPRLDAHFVETEWYEQKLDRHFLAADTGRPSLAVSAVYDAPLAMAAKAGCDTVFEAGLGNATFSQHAPWAYIEFSKSARWRELWLLARDHPGDARPIWRRLFSRCVIPLLPEPLRDALRTAVHGPVPSLNRQASLIRPEMHEELRLDDLARSLGDLRRDEGVMSKEEWLRGVWRASDIGAEHHYAAEQMHGVRLADPTAYRPLIEYCLGLPTDQFVRDGEQRWLARRMARGRMPEAQRTNPLYARHNSDWHSRMSGRLLTIRAAFDTMEQDEELRRLIDLERGRAMLLKWSDGPPDDVRDARAVFNGLNGAIIAARFHRYATGSNTI